MPRPVGLRGWGHRPSPGSGARGGQWPAQVELGAAPRRRGGMGRPGVCRLVLLAACLELCGPRGALGGTRPNFPSPPGAGQAKLHCAEGVGGRVGARAGEAAGRAGREAPDLRSTQARCPRAGRRGKTQSGPAHRLRGGRPLGTPSLGLRPTSSPRTPGVLRSAI